MNKKNVYKTIFFLVLASSLMIWFFWLQDKLSSNDTSAKLSQAEQLEQLAEEAKDNPEKSKTFLNSLYATMSQKEKHQYQMGLEAGIEEVKFYGRVLDQHGDPVVGAAVEFEAGGALLAAGSGRGKLLTDEKGEFYFRAKGGSILIKKISHPAIKFLFPNHVHSYGGEGFLGFWPYQREEGGDELLWTDYYEGKPYVFQAWRINSAKLVTNLNSGRDNFRADCEGNAYTINMLAPFRTGKRLIRGDVEGQLRIRFFCEEAKATETADWSAELEVIDGGLMETTDVYMYEAPDSGYRPSYSVAVQKNQSSYYVDTNKKLFYFYSNGGREYGSLIVSFSVFHGGPLVSIAYNINPNGGRSLLEPNE